MGNLKKKNNKEKKKKFKEEDIFAGEGKDTDEGYDIEASDDEINDTPPKWYDEVSTLSIGVAGRIYLPHIFILFFCTVSKGKSIKRRER